jgi:hypothetical protein
VSRPSRPLAFQVGDVLELKKAHPCGTNNWQVVRLGADIGLMCTGCGHRLLIDRVKLEKAMKRCLNREIPTI